MSIKNPNIRESISPYILDNPIGVDIIVKELQSSLSGLSWGNTSFNRAETMSRITQEGEDEIFPKLWVNGGKDEINALGLDKFSSYSFFHSIDDSSLFGDYQLEGNRYTQDLDLYFWFDLKRIDNSKTYDFLPELVEEIKQTLNKTYINYGEFQINNIVNNELDIYSDFSIDVTKHQNVYHPYRAVKIELVTLFYDVNCTQ